jgi:class 3 adenylate cyclase
MPVFLLTDIEGSTVLWERYGEAMRAALARHDAILARAVAAHGGALVRHTGDGAFAVFRTGEPLACALTIQRRMAAADWGAVGEVHTRIAIHMGEAEERSGDFYGPAVNKILRLCETAWGGEIVVSGAAAVLPLPPEATLQDLGVHLLRDLGEAERVYRLDHPDLPYREFPPLRSLRSHPNNLPPQATPIVGREEDRAAV